MITIILLHPVTHLQPQYLTIIQSGTLTSSYSSTLRDRKKNNDENTLTLRTAVRDKLWFKTMNKIDNVLISSIVKDIK